MLLYVMLHVMLAYLMMFAAISNAVCLYDSFFSFAIDFANAFYLHALSWFINTSFVYFMYYLASCTVPVICLLFLILFSHRFFVSLMKGLCALWRIST